ncbi:MAG: cobalamin-dependent protein [Phycisphaerales bacterium]|nr:MAG: cobalamin-dependent protein [Phycisphaerales bacterium]
MFRNKMLTLINTNRMIPAIGPIGLDYVAGEVKKTGLDVEVLDLCFEADPTGAMDAHFRRRSPELVGISFRNVDDCFWPSADWFVPRLKHTVETIHSMSDAPVVIGGVGYSIFPEKLLEYTGADFGICGDGEAATVALVRQLTGSRRFADVPGLVWQEGNGIRSNPASWPDAISLSTARDSVDNLRYFEQGGQCGLETKRGCNRHCIYCADPLAKGNKLRLRDPSEIADEAQSLLAQGIDVLHICDSEFNVPRSHAIAVCEEFINRSLGDKIRWYAYLSPSPFDEDLGRAMARAGCVGIDFTGDSGCEAMLRTYRHRHDKDDLDTAVKLCRLNNTAVMIDLLLGGPGETPETVRETIDFIKQIDPDCAGASLGVRVYPRTAMEAIVAEQLQKDGDRSIRRKYDGPIDLFKPTFYISGALGERPAELVRDLIGADLRFFEPALDVAGQALEDGDSANYNYNQNVLIAKAIAEGARGAYWDILRRLRKNEE